MKLFIGIAGSFILLIITGTALGYLFWYKPKFKPVTANQSLHLKYDDDKLTRLRLETQAGKLKEYSRGDAFDETHCFLIDMGIKSGKKRFFVYNLLKDAVEMAGLVTHGSGSEKGGDELYFSNVSGSNCTSLGKYKVGRSYIGKFGLAYKLHGLDKTNSNAFERFVVLHSHACVPETAVYPLTICESWGCPTVSPGFLQYLKKYIDAAEKPILLEIYQ